MLYMVYRMNTFGTDTPTRGAAVYGLAIVGFIALVALGIWLAVYATRFVPGVANRIGGAAVYLGSVFTKAPSPALSVVPTPPTATTTLSSEASSTAPTSIVIPSSPTPSKRTTPTAGEKTGGAYQIRSAPAAPALSGLPDFVVDIGAIGYLATTSAESFIASSTVPTGSRPAVKFTIKNIGGSPSGSWRWSASIPTQTAYIYQSQPQQPLAPGDSIDYTLGFDQSNKGADQTISITANFDHAVAESDANNNSASAKLTVLGS